jgi:hypothetical protein
MQNSEPSAKSKAETTTTPKGATENSPDINSNAASGSNTSLTKKIRDIFPLKRGAVLKRIYAGLNSNSASSKKQTTQAQRMFTPHGISDLKLTHDEVMTLINSPQTSGQDRKDLQTYTQTSGTANETKNMNPIEITPNIDPTVYAFVKEDSLTQQPQMHYFIAYQFRLDGAWYATNLYTDKEQAQKAAGDKAIVRKRVCAIWL